MNVNLGGAGPGCSAMRVRRLHAGELPAGEEERVAGHIAGCERCKATERELQAERVALRAAMPFEQLAAGVAEKLAVREVKPIRPLRLTRFLAPLAVAASVSLAIFVSQQGGEEPGLRSKGGSSASLVAQDARGLHKVGDAPVAQEAKLKVLLEGVTRREEVILLVEPGETSLLYAGPAREGPQPGAFYWTGSAPRATVLVFLDDKPLDALALKARGRVAAPQSAEVLELTLTR